MQNMAILTVPRPGGLPQEEDAVPPRDKNFSTKREVEPGQSGKHRFVTLNPAEPDVF
jgi:hypothetical protein